MKSLFLLFHFTNLLTSVSLADQDLLQRDLLQQEIVALSQIRGQGAVALVDTGVVLSQGRVLLLHLHLNQGSVAQSPKRAGLKKAVLMFIKEKSQSTARAPGRRAEAPLVLKGIALWQEDIEVRVRVRVRVRVQRRRGVLLPMKLKMKMKIMMNMKIITAAPQEAVNLPKSIG